MCVTLDSITQIIQTLAVLAASGTAVWGIFKWRREHLGKRKIELAEESLALFYEARDSLSIIRNPLRLAFPDNEYVRGSGESNDAFKARRRIGMYFEYAEKKGEVFNKIHAMRYRFMALFGKDAAAPFSEMNKIINHIHMSAHSLYAQLANPSSASSPGESSVAKIKELEAVLWNTHTQQSEDNIVRGVNRLIRDLEDVSASALSKKTY